MQVVGLKNGWHTGVVMGGVSKNIHAKRLAQASAIRLELKATGGHFIVCCNGLQSCKHDTWGKSTVCMMQISLPYLTRASQVRM